jgi:hypothetical protein
LEFGHFFLPKRRKGQIVLLLGSAETARFARSQLLEGLAEGLSSLAGILAKKVSLAEV